MSEIALVNRSKLSPEEFAFHVEALRVQHARDFCPAYGLEPWNITAYDEPPPDTDVYPIAIKDDLGDPGILGDHSAPVGIPIGEALDPGGADATTPSHEACELRADPFCDGWRPWPHGGQVAYEAADAVEADSYPITVRIFGESRSVRVSNFVLPAWYIPGSPGPWDFMGTLRAPFTMSPGGYLVLLADDYTTSQIYARTDSRRLARHAHRMADPTSRVHRRLMYQPPRPTIALADVAEDPRR